MVEIISHVPLTPRIGTDEKPLVLGYYAMPVFADAIANYQGQTYRLSLDDLTTETEEMNRFLGNLSSLDLHWGEFTRNKDVYSKEKVTAFITDGINRGYIRRENCEVASCFNTGGCGKSEYLRLPEGNLYSDGNHKCVEGGECTLCHQPIGVQSIDSLLWAIEDSDGSYFDGISKRIYPEYAATEMKDHWTKLRGGKLLISRQRPTDFSVNVRERTFFLDNDLINYLNMADQNNQSRLNLYFCGKGVLRQTLLMYLAGRQYNSNGKWDIPRVVAVPRINLTSTFCDQPCQSINDYLTKGIDKEALKVFLLQALGSTGKEVTLDTASIYHIDLAVKKIQKTIQLGFRRTKPGDIIETLGNVDYRNTLQGLVKKIKRPNFSIKDINQSEEFLLSVMVAWQQ